MAFSNFLRLTHAKNQQGSNSSASNDILFNKSFLEKMLDLQRRFDSETKSLRQAIADGKNKIQELQNSAGNSLEVARKAIASDLPYYIVRHHDQLIADLLGPICRKLGFEIPSDQCPRLSSGSLQGHFAWKQFLSSNLKKVLTSRNDQQAVSQRFFIDNCLYLTSAFDRYFDLLELKSIKSKYLAVLSSLLDGKSHTWSDDCIVQLNQLEGLGFNKCQIKHHQVVIQALYAARKAGNDRQQMFEAMQQAVKSRRTNFVVYKSIPRFFEAFDLGRFNLKDLFDQSEDISATPKKATFPQWVARFLSGETLLNGEYQRIKNLLSTLTDDEFEVLKYFMQKDENKLLTVSDKLVLSNRSQYAWFDESRIPDTFQGRFVREVKAIDNLENAVAWTGDTQAMSLNQVVSRAKGIRERLQQCRKVFSGEASEESRAELDLKNIEGIPTDIASFNREIQQKEKQLEQNQQLLKVFKLITLRYCQLYRLRTKEVSRRLWGLGWGTHGRFGQRRAEKLFKAIQEVSSMHQAIAIMGQLMKQSAISSVFDRSSGLRKGSLNATMVRAINHFNQVLNTGGSTVDINIIKDNLNKFMGKTHLLGYSPDKAISPVFSRDDKLKKILTKDKIDDYSVGTPEIRIF